jgi:hypothetical protein
MKICNYQGNGVCINCDRVPPNDYGDICKWKAEELLDCLECIMDTGWTYEQEQIFADFGIEKEVRE